MSTSDVHVDLLSDRNLVGGAWTGASDGAELAVTDPATDAEVGRVPDGGAREARAAVEAAEQALPAWRAATAAERAGPLRRLSELLMARQEDLARLIVAEQGKPVAEARVEVVYAASFLDWAAEEGRRLAGEIVPASAADKRILVLRQPVGVAAAITPWNFPVAMIARKLGPALACGCTLVVKPAEKTPLSALALGALAQQAGVPAGVVNVVTGDPVAIADELLDNPAVRKLSFTGSTAVGRELMGKASRRLVRLSLELGGHAPFLVFDDADLEAAVAGAVASKFRNMGQTCVCANRFFVQEGIYDEFVGRLQRAVEDMPLGSGLDEDTRLGPLIDDAAVEKVQAHVADATDKGATLRMGGDVTSPAPGLTRRFYLPTILEGVTGDMLVSREETFGPVCPVRRFSTEDEALEGANDSDYGLAAYFYTRDASRLMRVAEGLEYGVVGANDGSPSTCQAPFGGMKQSGFGREGGKWAMDEYCHLKYVSWGL